MSVVISEFLGVKTVTRKYMDLGYPFIQHKEEVDPTAFHALLVPQEVWREGEQVVWKVRRAPGEWTPGHLRRKNQRAAAIQKPLVLEVFG